MNPTEPDPESASIRRRILTASRLLLAGSLMAVFAFLAIPTHAQSDLWRMDGFTADITVGSDGTLIVEETVEAFFLQPRHGIFRYVPYEGMTTDGAKYRIAIRLLGVTDSDGVRETVKETWENGNIVWRIGDADRTLEGEKTYIITYEVREAILRFEDHDELFWNVSGEGWDVDLPPMKAVVSFPPTDTVEVGTRCFTGAYGSTEEACLDIVGPGYAGFTTEAAVGQMSVAVSWPKGHIGTESLAVRLARFLAEHWHFALPLFALAFYWAAWKQYGDDPEFAVVTEYGPPEDLAPAEIMALLRLKSTAKDLSPSLIDLAVRGHLTITEIDRKWYLGGKDYLLKRTGKDEADLKAFEKGLMWNVFVGGEEKKVSDLRNTFYKDIPEFTEGVMKSLMKKGMFDAHPAKVRAKWIVPGFALLGFALFVILSAPTGWFWVLAPVLLFGFALTYAVRRALKLGSGTGFKAYAPSVFIVLYLFFGFGKFSSWNFGGTASPLLFVSVAVTAAIILGFGWAMPRWTPKGAAAVRHAKGFKTFISKVKKYRTEWEEQENIFEKVLPYALAFGLGKKWASAFDGLAQEPPNWYHGAAVGTWNPAAFESSISSMAGSFASVATSSPSSRSSSGGFGGGGFSGGGSGGGGGGSW